MGGFVARAALVHPGLRKSAVETILTLSSPHQYSLSLSPSYVLGCFWLGWQVMCYSCCQMIAYPGTLLLLSSRPWVIFSPMSMKNGEMGTGKVYHVQAIQSSQMS